MSPAIRDLPVVVIHPYNRCNCRCVMCDIWKRTEGTEIGTDTYARYLRDFETLHVQWVVFSGAEPLMHSGIERLCRMTVERGIRATILTSGLLLQRNAGWIVEAAGDVIVSLDGPPQVHDRVRGVPGAFGAIEAGVRAIRRRRPDFPISARCTVQRANHAALCRTADAAHALGLDSISFLAADLAWPAFDHASGWNAGGVALGTEEIEALEHELAALAGRRQPGFVRESPEKLRRIATHFRTHLNLCEPEAPACNAPWVSAVIETDSTVRPCFFHAPFGRSDGQGLLRVLNGPAALAFRSGLDVATNEICRRCVCSLNYRSPEPAITSPRTAPWPSP